MFFVWEVFSNVQAGGVKRFAEKGLRQTQLIKNISIGKGEEIVIDGLAGYKIVASSRYAKTGAPIAIFQVVLLAGQSYIIMQGLVGAESKKVFLTGFNAMVESFKRKQK